MTAGTRTTRTKNPTQADVIHTMLVQAVNKAQDAVLAAKGDEDRAKARGQRDALISMRDRVRRYLDGDLNALYG